MPVLFRDTVTRQPQYNAGIDTGHPIGRRIVAALDPRWSLTGKQISIVGSGYSVLPRTSGMAAIGNNASLMSEQFPGIAFPFTQIVVMGKITRTANTNVSAGPGDNSGNQLAGFQFSSGSGNNRFLLRATNSASGDSSYRAFSANATTASAQNIVLGANVVSNSSIDVYWNGVLDNGTFGNSGGGPSTGSPTWGRLAIGGIDRGTDMYADTGNDAGLIFIVAGLLTSAEHLSLAINPWQIHRPPARKLWLMGEASGTHTTTGDVAGGGATVAGTATHKTLHTTTGVATGGGATVAGAATHKIPHTTTGAVAGAGATVAGTATHKTLHTTTGAVTGGGATVAGAATHPHTTTGAVTGGGAAVAGASDHTTPGGTHTTTGDAAGAGATVTGAATHLTLHTTSGATEGGGAAVAGASGHLTLHETSGAVQGGGGATTGAAELISLNGGKSSYLRQWLMEYYEAEWAQKAPVLADPPAVAPTPVAQAARTITRRTVRAAVAEQKKPPPAPYRADPRAAVNDFIQKQTAAVARKARVAAAIDSQDLAALTRRQQQRSAEAEEAEDEEILLLAAVL